MASVDFVLRLHSELVVRDSDAEPLFLLWATADPRGAEKGSGRTLDLWVVDPRLEPDFRS